MSGSTQKTIFVVDDSDAILMNVSETLDDTYRVITMSSAKRMYALLEKIIPDMILLDIEMPEIKGTDAIVTLKSTPAWKDIPVMFLTGWGGEDFVIQFCLEQGALDVMHKPFSPALLKKRVENLIKLIDFAKIIEKISGKS
ncbi:MAG: response regulator [Oscillospiraceae bacterium]|jgi:putative two-component system response regulator|nr:response regulator [Oscillospiraceae bacterium]